ncbi:TPA: host-nuclease inhibitor protein Gam [Candidatus Taylorbacteria bacterium]|nr:host-nuclease inhibitor protein Gam [Candidatus Taylorbacteria bacterium]
MAKAKKIDVVQPASIQQAAEFIQEIGQSDRQITAINKKLNDRIEKLKTKAIAAAEPLSKRVLELAKGLYEYAEANRAQLTDGGQTKTISLPTGTMAWKNTPPAVHLKNVDAVIAEINKLGLSERFLRKPPAEVDKEAMLKDQDAAKSIKGVSIDQDEIFVIKPSESDAEIKMKLKKKLKNK